MPGGWEPIGRRRAPWRCQPGPWVFVRHGSMPARTLRERNRAMPDARDVASARPPAPSNPDPLARGDDEAEAGVRPVVAGEGLLDLRRRELLILRGGVEQIVEARAAISERGEPSEPEIRRLHHLAQEGRHLLFGDVQ